MSNGIFVSKRIPGNVDTVVYTVPDDGKAITCNMNFCNTITRSILVSLFISPTNNVVDGVSYLFEYDLSSAAADLPLERRIVLTPGMRVIVRADRVGLDFMLFGYRE